MANTTGLLTELGISGQNEEAAFKKGSQEGGVGFLNEPLVGAVRGLFSGSSRDTGGTGEGGRSFKEFFRDFKEQNKNNRDETIARGMGLPGGREQLRQQRETRLAVSKLDFPQTTGKDSAYNDRLSALNMIAEVAAKRDDADLLLKTQQQKMALRKAKSEQRKMETFNDRGDVNLKDETQSLAEKRATGIPIVPIGADPKSEDFQPSHAFYDANTDLYDIYHPDGTVEEDVDKIISYDIDKNGIYAGGAGSRIRVSDKMLAEATGQLGGAKAFAAARNGVDDFVKVAHNTSNIASIYTSFTSPQGIAGLSRDVSIRVDNGIRFLESTAAVFDGTGGGNGTYVDTFSGKTFKDNEYVYNGKRVTAAQQKSKFMSMAESTFEAFSETLPPHIRKVLAERGVAGARLKAAIMELAYLDARQQEPSNRGLSDKDIEAALARVGDFSANPEAFFEIQLTKARQSRNQLGRLGDGFADTEIHTAAQLRDFVWVPEKIRRVERVMDDNIATLEAALADIQAKNGSITEVVPADESRAAQKARLLGEG